MIAMHQLDPLPQPPPQPRRRAPGGEPSRAATRRRVRLAQRRAYLGLLRVGGTAAFVIMPLMLLVMLTANITSLNFALAGAQARKAALIALLARQDDRIAQLESHERLAAVAAQLKMHDPQNYLVVRLARPQPGPAPESGVALLGAVGQWLDATVSGSPR